MDGATLLLLSESHLVDGLRMPLGPAVRLVSAVADKIRCILKKE